MSPSLKWGWDEHLPGERERTKLTLPGEGTDFPRRGEGRPGDSSPQRWGKTAECISGTGGVTEARRLGEPGMPVLSQKTLNIFVFGICRTFHVLHIPSPPVLAEHLEMGPQAERLRAPFMQPTNIFKAPPMCWAVETRH